jgi:hypothetical protein
LEISEKFAKSKNSKYVEYAQIWELLTVALDLIPEKVHVWSQHPMGKILVSNIIEKFEKEQNY